MELSKVQPILSGMKRNINTAGKIHLQSLAMNSKVDCKSVPMNGPSIAGKRFKLNHQKSVSMPMEMFAGWDGNESLWFGMDSGIEQMSLAIGKVCLGTSEIGSIINEENLKRMVSAKVNEIVELDSSELNEWTIGRYIKENSSMHKGMLWNHYYCMREKFSVHLKMNESIEICEARFIRRYPLNGFVFG